MAKIPSKVKSSSSGATLDGHVGKLAWVDRKIHRLAGSFLLLASKKPSKVMPRGSAKKSKNISVGAYSHPDKKRKNNPPVGLVSTATDPVDHKTTYKHDPHIDPYLSWAGKVEGNEFDVRNVSLHIHERIDPQKLSQSFLKPTPAQKQKSLFEQPANNPPLNKAIAFYQHEQDWSNRLIAGDSLLVMDSLLNKEGMAGKVQMVYIDPPYGIKYNSNFQPFVNKTQVKDNNDGDIPAEPEMIQAFRDTWELGIHSYLTHLRNRLLLAKELLNERGSCFVQISDQNIHHAKELMDEVFLPKNFISLITFRKKPPLGAQGLGGISDYVLWYAKDKDKYKYRKLLAPKVVGPEDNQNYSLVELPDGTRRRMTSDEFENVGKLPDNWKLFGAIQLTAAGLTQSCVYEFEFKGKKYFPKSGSSWRTNEKGMRRLIEMNRLIAMGKSIYYVYYFDDYPATELTNLWADTRGPIGKTYVVQTDTTPIQRCLLMTTDPGDLVFDPTCGSGTTAYVAEQWGRRWITCDTSRVAITLAKQRLMTSEFDYYQLAHPSEGVISGFKHKTIPHVTLRSIAQNESAQDEVLYDQPLKEKNKVRVSGPFTVEAVPSLRVRPFDGKAPKVEAVGNEFARLGDTGREKMWMEELKATGIRALGGKKIEVTRIEPLQGMKFLHAEADVIIEDNKVKKALVSFGPDYGPLEQRQAEAAIKELRDVLKIKIDFLIFAAFHFDPEAAKDIDQMKLPGVQILKAQMSVDLLTSDLRKKRSSNQSYWLLGQPDIEVINNKDGTYTVNVLGFDYYDPISGEVESKDSKHIAMWCLDTDYDERSVLAEQVFFPITVGNMDWSKLAKALNGEVDEEALEAFTGVESLPFKAGEHKKIAVKIVDTRGIESLVIKDLK